ncbi:hypothetical protein JCM11641_003714 [Rhodosporidiobolus odoratus]
MPSPFSQTELTFFCRQPSPTMWPLDTSAAPRPSISIAKSEPLPSPYLFGEPLSRVRTRTSSSASSSPFPSDVVLSPVPATSPYTTGAPLSRTRTRTSSAASLSLPASPQPRYSDAFAVLTSSHLTLYHLFFRSSVAISLTRIRFCRPLLTRSQRIRAACGKTVPADAAWGVSTNGLGWTDVVRARDSRRVEEKKAQEGRWWCLEWRVGLGGLDLVSRMRGRGGRLGKG